MSRHEKNIIEDIADFSSILPIWVSLLLAIISFVIIHQFADITQESTIDMNNMSTVIFKNLFGMMAYFFQFIIPFAFCLGALASVIKNRKTKKNYAKIEFEENIFSNKANMNESQNGIQGLNWRDFEILIAEFFQKQGFKVKGNFSDGPDGGVDLTIHKNNKKYIVQCKHWKKSLVGVSIVREQFGIMHSVNAHGVYIVASGDFTQDAIRFAKENNISLINGSDLRRIIKEMSLKGNANKRMKHKTINYKKTFFITTLTVLFLVAIGNLKTYFYDSKKEDNIIIENKKTVVLQQPKTQTKINNYMYLIYLKNGGTLKASDMSRNGTLYTIKTDSGLLMKIARSEIQDVKKMKL